MSTAVGPRLDLAVAEARKIAGAGLASATGLGKSRWIVLGLVLGIVGLAVALLAKDADPTAVKLAMAPPDDEPITPEERAAIDAARAEDGEIPWEEARKELEPTAQGRER